MLSRDNKVAKRRAFRGLAAAERLQGQLRAAIKHQLVVLDLSKGGEALEAIAPAE